VNPLPGARLPAASEHDDDVKRPPGLDVIWQVVPTKFVPEAETAVPKAPKTGSRVNVAAPGAVKDACPVSPVVPVTSTVYGPLAPDATTNDPDSVPPDTVQSGPEMRPLGVEEIEQPESPKAKFVPVTSTLVPGPPAFGSTEMPGSTVSVAVATSLIVSPVKVSV
jgi:hypothetical protein